MSIDPTSAGSAGHSFWHVTRLCLADDPVTPLTLWQSWSLAPAVLIPLALLLLIHHRTQAVASGMGSSEETARRRRWFMAGWLLLAVALVSPLCRLSATLVWVHMVQFMVLSCLAPASLALARTFPLLAQPGWPASSHPAGEGRSGPPMGLATAAYGAAIWIWHAPAVYQAVLVDPFWHWLGYATLIAASVLFWSRLVEHGGDRLGEALAAVLGTMLHTGLLGALLTFAPRVLYPVLADGATVWNLSALQDQQLGGLIMWVGGGVFYLLVALLLVAQWFRARADADVVATAPDRL